MFHNVPSQSSLQLINFLKHVQCSQNDTQHSLFRRNVVPVDINHAVINIKEKNRHHLLTGHQLDSRCASTISPKGRCPKGLWSKHQSCVQDVEHYSDSGGLDMPK